MGVGWHIWHNNAFSPLYRAEQDYAEFGNYSDFLKVVMYNNCGGPRMAQYIQNVTSSIFGDLAAPDDAMALHNRLLNYKEATSISALRTGGLSADYVTRETKRALAGVREDVH